MKCIILRTKLVVWIKTIFDIKNFTLFCRKKKQSIEKIIYKEKYTSKDIIDVLICSGVKPGRPIIVHSAYSNLYNYEGTPNELIDAILDYLGPEGTLCMPSFPEDRRNPDKIFDVNNSPSAAGYLTEVFRKREGVKRSLNKLHPVCALGKDADLITSSHVNSKICFDKLSPFYIIGELGGYIVNIGMPKWYVGTGEHVCEALLYDELSFFHNKFSEEITFTYIDEKGQEVKQSMLTGSKEPYIRTKSTELFDSYFDKSYYNRIKKSNLWITCFDMHYLINRLSELAILGKTIYRYPEFK